MVKEAKAILFLFRVQFPVKTQLKCRQLPLSPVEMVPVPQTMRMEGEERWGVCVCMLVMCMCVSGEGGSGGMCGVWYRVCVCV